MPALTVFKCRQDEFHLVGIWVVPRIIPSLFARGGFYFFADEIAEGKCVPDGTVGSEREAFRQKEANRHVRRIGFRHFVEIERSAQRQEANVKRSSNGFVECGSECEVSVEL